jgi:lipid-A-disaccharide synthase
MVVCYRVSMLTYLLARPFIKVRFASLVNLVAGKEVVPELLQSRATPVNIYRKILPLLVGGEAKKAMQQELMHVRKQLGCAGASRRAAELAIAMMAPAG